MTSVLRAGLQLGRLGQAWPGIAGEVAEEVAHALVLPTIQQEVRASGLVDEGGLLRSWRVATADREAGREVTVQSSHPGAGLLSHGGEVRPVEARALTVPVAPEARRRTAAEFPGAFMVIPKDGGPPMLGVKTGKDGFKPLFLLLQRVRIPGRHYLEHARDKVDEQAPGLVREKITERMHRAVA